MMVTFENLTPDVVRVLDEDDNVVCSFEPPAEKYFQLAVPGRQSALGSVAVHIPGSVSLNPPQVPLVTRKTEDVCFMRPRPGSDLPEPREGTLFIVTPIIQAHCPDRDDFVVPFPRVQDENGQIVGCRGFAFQGEASYWQRIPTPALQKVKTLDREVWEKRPWPEASEFFWIWEIQKGALLEKASEDIQ